MEANCALSFSETPYFANISEWHNIPTIYERCEENNLDLLKECT